MHFSHRLFSRMRALVVAVPMLAPALVAAQDRMPPIPPEKLTDAQRKASAEFEAARGTPVFGPFVPLLRSPEVINRARAMGDYLRYKSALPPRLSEFVILVVARQWTQQLEWQVHHPIAIKAGVKPETLQALAEGRRPKGMTEDEEILYDLCDELDRHKSVTDATYARALARFGETGVVDAVSTVGYYTFLAMVMNTARTPAPDGSTPLAPFPR
jgi:4-carboxymuconolactone decarboxylase